MSDDLPADGNNNKTRYSAETTYRVPVSERRSMKRLIDPVVSDIDRVVQQLCTCKKGRMIPSRQCALKLFLFIRRANQETKLSVVS